MDEMQRRIMVMRAARNLARRIAEEQRQKFMAQLLRYGLCTCLAMGRYSTCCAKLLNVKDGFYYIKWSQINGHDKR